MTDMTNHPNRNRTYDVSGVRLGERGIETFVIGRDLPKKEAMDMAQRAAGKGATFGLYSRQDGTSYAYFGSEVTAVISGFETVPVPGHH